MRLLCVLLALSWISIEALIQVDPTSGFFLDEYGRVRIFHGVNAVYKATPWYPEPQGFDPQNSLSAEDAQNLQNWGFNAVRLGVMFPGVEPTLGYFNTTYLDTMNGIIDTLYQYGIYSIVDTHQDLYNGKFCGEGFPDWAVDETHSLPFAMPVGPVLLGEPPNGYPNLTLCHEMSFFEYYLSEAVGVAFQNLYNNTNGLQDEFATYWSTLAEYFNGAEGVLGYELINEPWAGNIYGDIDLLLPGVADQKNLAPMYKLLNGAIREYDDEHIIFFEKAVSNEVGSNGLTEGPGGPLYNNRQAYSYHIYCAPTDSYGTPTNITACNIENSYLFEDSMKDMKDMGVYGGFLTEFGAVPNTPPSIDAIQYLTELADTKFQSWSYWQFKYFNDITTSGTGESFYDENGNLEQAKVKTLSRTYAQAIAGTPSLMHFFPDNATFVLRYKWNTDITEPTIIFLNEAWYYPNGFKVDITPSSSGTYKQIQTNYIQINKGAHVVNGEEILIEIKAV